MKSLLSAALALLLLAPLPGAAQSMSTLDQISKTGTIRLGYRMAQPPMSFADETGEPRGYSIDLCERIVTGVKTKLDRSDIGRTLQVLNLWPSGHVKVKPIVAAH